MAKQLVVLGNRILAYGEDCFTVMGEVVKCSNTGNEYPNATVTTCEEFPADIGKVGYEFHAGQFVPCAPFGDGMGTVAVFCDACNAMKNSGIDVRTLLNNAHIYETSYGGGGKYGSTNKSKLNEPLPFIPKMLFIMHESGTQMGIIFNNGFGLSFTTSTSASSTITTLTADLTTENPTWYGTSAPAQLNTQGVAYRVIAIG